MSEGQEEIQQVTSTFKRTIVCDNCLTKHVTEVDTNEWTRRLRTQPGWYHFSLERGSAPDFIEQFDFCSDDCLSMLKELVLAQ